MLQRNYTKVIKPARNLHWLKERGFFQNIFPQDSEVQLAMILEKSPCCMYCGFDPTADSLHIGHLLPIIALLHCHRAGHEPIALIGGSTALIGDPTGRTKDRSPLTEDIVHDNVASITHSLETIFSNHDQYISNNRSRHRIKIINNSEWYKNENMVEFLSSVGRHFRMGAMLSRQSVKSRLEGDEGMSFTEFSYQIFQAYDWLKLYQKYRCMLQIGGNDQMGNIMSGHDLMGRVIHTPVYSLTVPLVTSKTGSKIGKSAGNAVWLNSSKTTAFEVYQFFINVADMDVERFLRLFTFLSDEEIRDVLQEHMVKPHERLAQKKLADQVTLLVHGDDGLHMARHWTQALIGRDIQSLYSMNQSDLLLLFKSAPCVQLGEKADLTVLDVCMRLGCFTRTVDAERVIKEGGVRFNHQRVWHPDYVLTSHHILPTHITIIQIGKKSNFYVVQWRS